MFMKSKDGKNCSIYCSCGCDNGIVLKAEREEFTNECYISLVSDRYYSSQQTKRDVFKEKCKRIWKIITNQEHHYFGLFIEDEDIKEFKEFVAKL